MSPDNVVVQFVNRILLSLFSILPDSPFRSMISFSDDYQLLGVLNFFIPFDIASEMLSVWLLAVIAYYTYNFIKGTLTLKNSILDGILKFLL